MHEQLQVICYTYFALSVSLEVLFMSAKDIIPLRKDSGASKAHLGRLGLSDMQGRC